MSRFGNRQEMMDEYEDDTDPVRERVARAIFERRGFSAWAWDEPSASVNGLRRDCRWLAEAAIAAMQEEQP